MKVMQAQHQKAPANVSQPLQYTRLPGKRSCNLFVVPALAGLQTFRLKAVLQTTFRASGNFLASELIPTLSKLSLALRARIASPQILIHPKRKGPPHYMATLWFSSFVKSLTQTTASSSTSFANRLRAVCRRRLMVPIGASNSSAISISD